MKLSRFSVENHARLEDATIEIRSHLVLVGANDVGKSSLMRCLDLVLGSTTAALYARVSADDFRNKAEPFVIEVELVELDPDEKAHFPDEATEDPASGIITLTIRLEATIDDGETLSIRRFAPQSGSSRQVSREQLAALGWKMVAAAHSQVRDFKDDRNAALEDIFAAIDLGAERAGFQEAADAFQGQLSDSVVLGQLRKRLAGQLSKAVPQEVAADDLSFVAGTVVSDDLLSDVRLRVARAGEPRPVAEQSDGARALFAIALYDLVSGAANVVAIDEPEIHLHPSSQRSLARLLRSGSNQKVIATHSPDVVSAFAPDDIVVVRRGGKLVQPSSGFLNGDSKLAAHWWVNGQLEPLTASLVILVEGISDRIVLQRSAELTGRDLDRLGVSVLDVTGSGSVIPARKVFGPHGFDVPLRILIDEDAVARTAKDLQVEESDLNRSGVTVSKKDLEAEYVTAIGPDELWTRFEASGEFTPNRLANCRADVDGTRSAESVAEFCRKYKVLAALVVANTLTEEEARRVLSIESLLVNVQLNV